jgi:hypothetical protein
MQRLVRERCPKAKVCHYGVPYINPRHLAFVILTPADKDRDDLRNDASLEPALRSTLVPNGYPPDAAPLVGFRFESEETIKRDFGGNWYHAMNS